ncbi:MAG: 5-(carboxyamino)imidazole ribonucleotide synthase [Acidobacteriota bacterium]
MKRVLPPGSVIGVLGSGQLGRMFAIAARRMGYRVHTLSPDEDTPTGQVSDVEIRASYDDLDAVRAFASRAGVVTFEFENIPAASMEACAAVVPVHPRAEVLHLTQHRLREKTFLAKNGFPCAPFRHVRSAAELEAAAAHVGLPAVLKTAGFGYDGKGQRLLKSPQDLAPAWGSLGAAEAVLEKFIDFECELSVVAARDQEGRFDHFPVCLNSHSRHILDLTLAPAPVEPRLAARAVEITRAILETLDAVGVLCVEFFLARNGDLLVNEIAPRPHNSGHYTFDACVTSQFEQQLRAVCGLPLGSTEQVRPAAMANLLGDLWGDGEPHWQRAAAFPGVKLHVYGKLEARPGRKMGHLTALAQSVEAAKEQALAARASLTARAPES